MILLRWIVPPVTALALCCSSTTRLRHNAPVFIPGKDLARYTETGPFTGFGKIRASSEGEKFFGTFEVQSRKDRSLKMVFYSPLGTFAGAISARNDSVVLRFGENEHVLAFSDTFSGAPLRWGNLLSAGELIQALCGRVMYLDSLLLTEPEEIIHSGFRNTYIWRTRRWKLSASFSGKSNRLRQVVLEKNGDGTTVFSIRFTSFSNGAARFISMKVDDRNYFSITYEQLHYNK
jgi:hypothetical protein